MPRTAASSRMLFVLVPEGFSLAPTMKSKSSPFYKRNTMPRVNYLRGRVGSYTHQEKREVFPGQGQR